MQLGIGRRSSSSGKPNDTGTIVRSFTGRYLHTRLPYLEALRDRSRSLTGVPSSRKYAAASFQAATPAATPVASASAGTSSTVYVAAVPLEGFEAAERLLGERYPDRLALHTMVVLRSGDGTITAFDFLPLHPTAIITTASLLSGGTVHGVARTRQLTRLPRRRCWLVGTSPLEDDEVAVTAHSFQAGWYPHLRLMSHDCRHHTMALVAALCNEPSVFDRIPELKSLRL